MLIESDIVLYAWQVFLFWWFTFKIGTKKLPYPPKATVIS